MSEIRKWNKVGEPKILAQNYGKKLIDQIFFNPINGQIINYTLFDTDRVSVIIFPLTTNFEVVVMKQFRPAIEEIIIELPGGNIDPEDKDSAQAADRELFEETGYRAGRLIKLPDKLWVDPGSCKPFIYSFLALDCREEGKPEENTERLVVPIASWKRMIANGEILDMKTLAITLLATSILRDQELREGNTDRYVF